MFRRIVSGISMPTGFAGSSSNDEPTKSGASRKREHAPDTLKWINDNRRQANECRTIAADRLADAKRGGKVDLENLGLTDMPDNLLAHADGSVQIKLRGNNLNAIPRRMLTFRKLQFLDLSKNQLATLTPEIGAMTGLRKLDVSGNGLPTLPESIGNLTALTTLRAGDNALEDVPTTIGKLTNLTKLSLSGNLLKKLPAEIKDCSSLEELDLSRNHFERLSKEIGALTKLNKLRVNDNALADRIGPTAGTIRRAIPESIGELPNLKEFDVSGNPLTFLPNAFGGFKYASTSELTIKRFANEMPSWSTLEIRIANTPLPVELPKEGRLKRLKTVAPVRYRELYQPPGRGMKTPVQESSFYDDEDGIDSRIDDFEERSIPATARVMPEVLAAQNMAGGNGLGVLNELLRSLAANGAAAGGHGPVPPLVQPGMPPGYPQPQPMGRDVPQPHTTQVPLAQPYMAQPPLYGQAMALQSAGNPALVELLQRLELSQGGQPRPMAHAAPLHTAPVRQTLFDYSTPSYTDAAQRNIDMRAIRRLQKAKYDAIAEVHKTRIYLQDPHLEQLVQEARKGDPKRDLWTLGRMMFRQRVICELAGDYAEENKEKNAKSRGNLKLSEDPLAIAMLFEALVCRPSELQILGFDDMRDELDRDPDFRSTFASIVPVDQYDFFRSEIMREVREREEADDGAEVEAHVNKQAFWQKFLQEHVSAAKASWISAHGF
jgi:Leucine rich repeat/Leucine Rich Repeat